MPRYAITIASRALKELSEIPEPDRSRIQRRIDELADNLAGDVKKLTNHTPRFRMRAGRYRVLFDIEGTTVMIYRVAHRRDVYD